MGDAKAALLKAQSIEPDNPKAIELVGMAAFATQDWVLAKRQLERMLEGMSPDRAEYIRFEQTIRVLDERIKANETRAAAKSQKTQ